MRTAAIPGRRRARGALIALAACCVLPASAGLLTTEQTVANFTFAGDQVDYAPDPKTFAPAADSTLTFTATDPTLGLGWSDNTHDPLRGALHVFMKGSNYGSFGGSDVNVFGSLPTLNKAPESRLLNDSIKALRPDSKPGTLEFLIDRDRIVGRLASRYRGVGIFMLVSGVDDLTWVQGFADGAATMELLQVEDDAADRGRADRDQ
ncbi:hypothetical protein [uncultured Thiodictyon sp.]|uniref:hypothetical protein n=1 Tax=uncultured Thiodictyon sp. TaxID=1846217 RepID=UPI0025DAAEE5|nr:hypothetical protein [uncultured Thiodictyon sp.]